METRNTTGQGKRWYWIYSREGELVGSCSDYHRETYRIPAPMYVMGRVPPGGFPRYETSWVFVDFEPLEPGNRDLTGAYLVDERGIDYSCAELPSGRLCKLYAGRYEGSWSLTSSTRSLGLRWLCNPEPVLSLFKHKLRKRETQ